LKIQYGFSPVPTMIIVQTAFSVNWLLSQLAPQSTDSWPVEKQAPSGGEVPVSLGHVRRGNPPQVPAGVPKCLPRARTQRRRKGGRTSRGPTWGFAATSRMHNSARVVVVGFRTDLSFGRSESCNLVAMLIDLYR
jgi:hypothetical protein